MEKKFLTYDQQIEKLQSEKQLTISDVPTAIHTLEHISYYSLMADTKICSNISLLENTYMVLHLKKLLHFIILMKSYGLYF